jgi:hypothetical protein
VPGFVDGRSCIRIVVRIDQSLLNGIEEYADAIVNFQSMHGLRLMRVGRAFRDIEFIGDLTNSQAACHQREHFSLPFRKNGRRFVGHKDRRRIDQSLADRETCQIEAVTDAKQPHKPILVRVDGLLAAIQTQGHFGDGQPSGEVQQDIALCLCKLVDC